MKSFYLWTLLIAALILSGCTRGPTYDEGTKNSIGDDGKELMEEWMKDYYPEGKVLSAEPYVYMYPSGPHYLTDFVEGTMFDGEKERTFSINITTGEVALQADPEMWEEFQACAKELYLESLDFSPESVVADFDANVAFDLTSSFAPSSKGFTGEGGYNAAGLPGELVAAKGDIPSYVRDRARKDLIAVAGWITVSDDMDLSRYTFEDISSRQKQYGLIYRNLYVYNEHDRLTSSRYERWAYEEWEGRTVWTRKAYRSKDMNGYSGIDTKPDIQKSARLLERKDGFTVQIDEDAPMVDFTLYVEEGDPLLEHLYRADLGDTHRELI